MGISPKFYLVWAVLITLGPASPAGADPKTTVFLGNSHIPPMAYLDGGVPHGVVVDLFQAIRPLLGQDTEIRLTDWKGAQEAVASGQADALVQINRTPERELLFDFSEPLLESRFVIFVRDITLGISSVDDLKGKRVGVEAAGLPRQFLTGRVAAELVVIPDFPTAFTQLAEGTLDAVVVDQRVGEYVLATRKIGGIKSTGLPVSTSFSSIAVRKGNRKLLDQINRALESIHNDGTYQKILANWNPTEVIFETHAQQDRQQYLVLALVLGSALVFAFLWILGSFRSLRRARSAEASLRSELVARDQRAQELRESEERYRLLVTSSTDPVLLHQDGIIVYVNPAALRLFGAQNDSELLGTPIVGRVHPEYRELVQNRIGQIALGRTMDPVYEKFLRLDGTAVDVEVSGSGLLLAGRSTVLVLVRELTERNQARARQESLLKRYETILNAASDGIHILTPEGAVVDVNPAFCTMLGYSREELLSMNVGDWDARWSPGDLTRKIRGLFDNPAVFSTKHRRKDGTVLDVEISGVVIELDGSRYLYAAARNITDRKYLERKLEREQRLDSLGVLAGGIAHDFNNILAGLSGQVEIALLSLKNGNLPGTIARLERIPAVVDRGRALSGRLLTFSKGGTPVRAPMSLAGPLAEWLDFALTGSDLLGSLEIQPDLWKCLGDINQLGQVVSNLLINARQASFPGGTILVRATNVYQARPLVSIEITDQGPGVPPDLADQIFDPFFTTKAGGSGLGLSVAFSIVQQHGGTLRAFSPPGGGATFALQIPADPELEAIVETPREGNHSPGGTILVMDDEELIRDSVGINLMSLGYQVLLAHEGTEVLRIAEEKRAAGQPVRLFILDGLIPAGMGGQETLKQLRQLRFETPAILMSGYFDTLDQGSVPTAAQVVRLAKPFSMNELSQALGILLGTR